eukprot:9494371-Pyramimonas_sp.AAC.2
MPARSVTSLRRPPRGHQDGAYSKRPHPDLRSQQTNDPPRLPEMRKQTGAEDESKGGPRTYKWRSECRK